MQDDAVSCLRTINIKNKKLPLKDIFIALEASLFSNPNSSSITFHIYPGKDSLPFDFLLDPTAKEILCSPKIKIEFVLKCNYRDSSFSDHNKQLSAIFASNPFISVRGFHTYPFQLGSSSADLGNLDYLGVIGIRHYTKENEIFFRFGLINSPHQPSLFGIFLSTLKALSGRTQKILADKSTLPFMLTTCLCDKMGGWYELITSPISSPDGDSSYITTQETLTLSQFGIVLLQYFSLEWDALLPKSPVETALSLYGLSKIINGFTFVNVLKQGYFSELRQRSNPTPADIDQISERIREVKSQLNQIPRTERIKGQKRNSAIVASLQECLDKNLLPDNLIPQYLFAFCQCELPNVKEATNALRITKYGPPKKPYRLTQKYQEKASRFLKPSWELVLNSMKDLFRGTIVLSDFDSEIFQSQNHDVVVRNVEQKNFDSGYSAFYIELDVRGCSFELQIVPSIENAELSHGWYELFRISQDNELELLCKRFVKSDISFANVTSSSHALSEDEINTASQNPSFPSVVPLPPSSSSK